MKALGSKDWHRVCGCLGADTELPLGLRWGAGIAQSCVSACNSRFLYPDVLEDPVGSRARPRLKREALSSHHLRKLGVFTDEEQWRGCLVDTSEMRGDERPDASTDDTCSSPAGDPRTLRLYMRDLLRPMVCAVEEQVLNHRRLKLQRGVLVL